jgi:hypothetical protein
MAKRDTLIRKALRQGELLFVPLSKEDYARLFGDEKDVTVMGWRKLDTQVIREGEATGHKHEIMTKLAVAATLLADGPIEIVHPEHKPLTLPKGMHLVIVQREYDEARPQQVLD